MDLPLFLTFDDGPDPDWTPRVADVLARHRARATFFVLGWRVRERPDIVADLLAAGHRVELHGDAHFDHGIATADELRDDTAAAMAALRSAGADPEWWRIPFGRPGLLTPELAAEHGLRVVGWDVDTHDWRGDGWANQPAQVSDAADHGGVVLLHDAVVFGTPRSSAENTLEVVEVLLQHAARHHTPVLALPDATTELPIPVGARPSPFERTRSTARRVRDRYAIRDASPPVADPAEDRSADRRPGEPA